MKLAGIVQRPLICPPKISCHDRFKAHSAKSMVRYTGAEPGSGQGWPRASALPSQMSAEKVAYTSQMSFSRTMRCC